jgi:hypothetical protein
MKNVLLVFAIFAVLTLAACAVANTSTSSFRLDQLTSVFQNVKTAQFEVAVTKASWLQQTGLSDSKLTTKCVADLRDPSDQRFRMEATLAGKTGGNDVSISGEVLGLGNYTFLRLTGVSTTQLGIPGLSLTNQWYRLANPISGSKDKILGQKDWIDITTSQMIQLRRLVGQIDWLQVKETLPDEMIDGQLTSHWVLMTNDTLLVAWLKQVASVTGLSLSADQIANYLASSRLELWQSRRFQHRPVKVLLSNDTLSLTISFTGWDIATNIISPTQPVFDLDWSKLIPNLSLT